MASLFQMENLAEKNSLQSCVANSIISSNLFLPKIIFVPQNNQRNAHGGEGGC